MRNTLLVALVLLLPSAVSAQEGISVQTDLDSANSLVVWGLIIAGVLIVGSIVFSIIRHSIKLLFSLFLLAIIAGGALVWYGHSQGIDIAKENQLEYEVGPFLTVGIPQLDLSNIDLPDVNLPSVNISIGQ